MTDAAAQIDGYIAAAEPAVAEILRDVLATSTASAPGATEAFRHGMPAVMFRDRYGLHYAGWKKHLGLCPVGELDEPPAGEVAPFRSKKDTVNLPYRNGVPLELIGRIGSALAARHADADSTTSMRGRRSA